MCGRGTSPPNGIYLKDPEHPGGRALVPGAWRGRNVVWVDPEDPRLRPASVVCEVDGATPPSLRIALQAAPLLTVRVVDERGVGVAGARLRLIDPNGTALPDLADRVQ